MTGPSAAPKNIFYFEVLLYLSLLIDVLSAAFLDRMPDEVTESTKLAVNFIAVMMTLGFSHLIWLAAHRRKNWARMVLLAALLLSVFSIIVSMGQTGLQFGAFVDVVSTALTALGMLYAFTGDAQEWFREGE